MSNETTTALIGALVGAIAGGGITLITTFIDTKRKEKKETSEKVFQNHKEFMDSFAKLRSLIWQIHTDHRLYSINTNTIQQSAGSIGNNPLDSRLTEEMILEILKNCNEGKVSFQNKYTLTIDSIRNKINFYLHYYPNDSIVKQGKQDLDQCVNSINKDLDEIKKYYDISKNHFDEGKYINEHLEKYKAPLNKISEQMLNNA